MNVQVAEALGKDMLSMRGDGLVAEEEHLVLQQGIVDARWSPYSGSARDMPSTTAPMAAVSGVILRVMDALLHYHMTIESYEKVRVCQLHDILFLRHLHIANCTSIVRLPIVQAFCSELITILKQAVPST